VRIYLDYNATAPVPPAVVDAVSVALRERYGNASSVHVFGQQAKTVLDESRSAVARLIGAEPSEIVFTAGGTESDNLAVRGVAEALESTGRRHLVISAIEHEAVLNTVKALGKRGWTTTLLPVDGTGVIAPGALASAIDDRTALVSVMLANNEVGTIQPVADLVAIARMHGALVHTDAVQAIGRLPVDVRALGVDLLTLSGHKFGAPKGVGALWVRRGLALRAQSTGGRQERGRRAGTENVPAIEGLRVAAEIVFRTPPAEARRIGSLRDRLESGILGLVPGSAVNGEPAARVPNTSNISFERVEAESLVIALDLEGIAVSTGSACSSGTLKPSHVLRAIGLSSSRVQSAIRFSLGPGTTEAEIDRVLDVLPALVTRLRSRGGGRG
jgi:cysteine desulfurase